jgi:hypothetical protein
VPGELRQLGYDVINVGKCERILAHATEQS